MLNHSNSPGRTTLLTAGTALVLLALAGCTGSGAPSGTDDCADTYTVGFSHPSSENAVVKAIQEEVRVAAEEIGCVEVLFDSTTGGDLESQRATLESWVTQQVDAVVVLPVDSGSLTSLQKRAQEEGVKWLAYAFDVEGSDGYAGFDSVASGDLVGEELTAWLESEYPDGGVSAMVTTWTTNPEAAGRWEGPISALNALDVPIVSEQDCLDQTCGLEITETVLNGNPDLRVVVGFSDDAALGASMAFTNAGIDPETVFIAGQDGSPQALAAILKGGAFKMSAALDYSDLAHSIVQNSINAVTGEGETRSLAGVVSASYKDTAFVESLLAQLGE